MFEGLNEHLKRMLKRKELEEKLPKPICAVGDKFTHNHYNIDVLVEEIRFVSNGSGDHELVYTVSYIDKEKRMHHIPMSAYMLKNNYQQK